MQTFLDKVLDEESLNGYQSSVFILPSRRSSNVLASKIASKSSQTTFAPVIYSIEEFIEHITQLSSADTIILTFTLYESYKEVVIPEKQVPFHTFCSWSQPILSDFNEIDRYLLNKEELFNHLTALKEITGHWSTASTDLILKYVDFWNNLGPIYDIFCSKSNAQGSVHQGLIYRQAVDAIEHYLKSSKKSRHVFVGFNALNTAEQQLIQAILSAGNSEIYWDTEQHFSTNPYHETTVFTNNYKKHWNHFKTTPFKWSFDNYRQPKNITTYATSQNIQQAKTVGSILSKRTTEQLSKTAIVLGDEALLLPILNSIPIHVKHVNITMGIPIAKTPTASFFDQIFTLKRTINPKGYYYKEVLILLRNPLTQLLLAKTTQLIERDIVTNNLIFVTAERIQTLSKTTSQKESVTLLFTPWERKVNKAVTNLSEIIDVLKGLFKGSSQLLQLEYLYGFYKAFNKLKQLIATHGYIDDLPTLIHFYREIISSETIDLRGDPKQGLQIMGVLESRVLDYEHVIMTSVNEGILPSGKSQNSYIPYDLKQHYGLPTYSEKDAIYAYHFYHLLHRAQHIDLLYTTNTNGLGSTEKSRFIRQMELEGVHTLKHVTVSPSTSRVQTSELAIYKSQDVLDKLNQLLQKGISPSALTTYLRNPILFYERYVLRINDGDEVEETVAANTMGTIVHNTLEVLYTPFINRTVSITDLESMLPAINKEVQNQFKQSYGLTHIDEGKNKIIFAVICRYIANYLHLEIDLLKKGDVVKIISLEADLKDIPLSPSVSLRGKVDLVENRNGNIRVIDYKTGKVEKKDLNLTAWEDLFLPEGKYEKAFQVLMYAYMLHKTEPLDFPVSIGIISFKNLQAGFLPFNFNRNQEVTEETLSSFETVLKKLIAEILNPEIPFSKRQ